MVCGPALLQGLVPPSQRSKAGAEQTPGLGTAGSGVGPHCPLTLQSLITSLGPYSPKLTLIPSFLCKHLNKLFSDRQVWVCSGAGERQGAELGFLLFLHGHLSHCSHRGSKQHKETVLKGTEQFLLYSCVFYNPYTYMPVHTHTFLQQACATSALKQLGFSLTAVCHPSLQGTLLPAAPWGAPWPGSPSAQCEGGRCVCWGPSPPPGWGRQPCAQGDAAGCA